MTPTAGAGLPEALKRRIQARAKLERRSLSAQVLRDLETIAAGQEAGSTSGGRFLGRFEGTRVPSDQDLREVRARMWRRLGRRSARRGCVRPRHARVREIVMLRELDRIDIGLPELEAAMETASSLRLLALDVEQLGEFSALTSVRDPFDRLVLSAARARNAKLITRDEALAGHGLVQVVWA